MERAAAAAAAGRVSRVRCRNRRGEAGAGPASGMPLLRLQAIVNSIKINLQAARDELDEIAELIDAIAEGVDDLADADKSKFWGMIDKATRWAIGECSGLILAHFAPSSTNRPLSKVKAQVDSLLTTGPLDTIWLLLPPELVDSTLDVVEFVFCGLHRLQDHRRLASMDVACLSAELPDKEQVCLETFNRKHWQECRKSLAHGGALDKADMCLEIIDNILERLAQQPLAVRQFFTLGD